MCVFLKENLCSQKACEQGFNKHKALWKERGGGGVLFLFLVFNILISAFEIYFMFPYMLQGYYKWKFPEEYREWEEKSVEEWYGKKYLNKHKELLKNG